MFAFCIRIIRSWRCRVLRATGHPWVMVWCALAGTIAAADVSAQACPANDPNQNYNCPIGPSYLLPSWGNVPWSLPQHYQDILSGDLDGDGRDELDRARCAGRPRVVLQHCPRHVATVADDERHRRARVAADRRGGMEPAGVLHHAPADEPAGRPGKVLAGRGASGLLLYGLTRASGPVPAFPAGTWTQLAPGGPFADADCFGNGKCWNAAPYYQTIRFGDIDGEPGDEVIGWGGDGVVAFKWNGSEWASLTGFPPGITPRPLSHLVLSRQFADMDGEPGQELLNWEQEGIRVHKYVPGTERRRMDGACAAGCVRRSVCATPNGANNPSCWSTLQTARLEFGRRRGSDAVARVQQQRRRHGRRTVQPDVPRLEHVVHRLARSTIAPGSRSRSTTRRFSSHASPATLCPN